MPAAADDNLVLLSRKVLATILLTAGTYMFLTLLVNFHTIKAGIIRKVEEHTVTKYVDKPVSGVVVSPVLKVQSGFEYTTSKIPTGEYQFIDLGDHITTMKFCEDPAPTLQRDTYLTIEYTPAPTLHDCSKFISATVISDEAAKHMGAH